MYRRCRRAEEQEEEELGQQRAQYRSKIAHRVRAGRGAGEAMGVGRSGGEGAVGELLGRAARFRTRQLLIRWGIAPWVLLVKERRCVWTVLVSIICTFIPEIYSA